MEPQNNPINPQQPPAEPVPTRQADVQQTAPVQPVAATAQATPMVQQATNPQPASGPVAAQGSKQSSKKLFIPILALFFLLAGGAAVAYNQLALNSPEKIWERSLKTTSAGLKEFLIVADDAETPKGYTVDGTFRLSGVAAIDGSVSGKVYENDSDFSADVGLSGLRLKGDIRTKKVNGASLPDIYIKADGLEPIAGILGLSGDQEEVTSLINEYNNKWFVVDHTLLEEIQSASGELAATENAPDISSDDTRQFIDTSLEVVDEYLLSTSEDTRVFTMVESYGQEEFEGNDTYRYDTGVDKDNLKLFLNAYSDAIKDTAAMKTLLELESADESFEEMVNLEGMIDSIDDTDLSDFKAGVWVDKDSKFIRNIRLTDKESDKNYLDIGLNYAGGDVFPFVFKYVFDSPSTNEDGVIEFTFDYNRESEDISLGMDISGNIENTGEFKLVGNLDIKGSEEKISIQVPSGATNVLDLLNSPIVNEALGGGSQSSGTPTPRLGIDSLLDDSSLDFDINGIEPIEL